MSRCVVMVGVSRGRALQPYVERFRETFTKFKSPDDHLMIWDADWPPNSPQHRDCHYAFKVYAVREGYRLGYTSIFWFDSSCYAVAPIEPLWQRLEREGHVLVEDTPNPLGKWSSDHSLATFGMSRDRAMNIPLMVGTCWGVDLTNARSLQFTRELYGYALPSHFNGTHKSRNSNLEHPRPGTEGFAMSNDERCYGHRSDEVYMSLLAHKLGMKTVGSSECEFVGGNAVHKRACVKSGYDLPGVPIG